MLSAQSRFAPAGEPLVVDGAAVTRSETLTADAVVIGTGAGGGPVAKELAEGGLDVLVLEEGAHEDIGTFRARPREMVRRLYRDGGQITTIGTPPIPLPLGKAVGGTTLVNSGTCFRTPPHVLARWREEAGLELELDAIFAHVEATIGVATVPAEIAGHNAAIARRGAEALGWSGGFLRRNAIGCVGSGVCGFGCPTGAKQHAGVAWMGRAWDAGAISYTHTRALRVETRDGIATGVTARTKGGATLSVNAPLVIVAAGTIHTPLLLARSGLGGGSGQLGHNLSIHPATAMFALMDEQVDMFRGVPQSYYVDEFAPEGIMFEGIAGPPDYLALGVAGVGEAHRELMLQAGHVAQFGVMVSDTSRGRVHRAAGRPLIRYDLNATDTQRFHTALLRLAELYWAAGARSVLLPIARLKRLDGGDSRPLEQLRLQPHMLKLMAFHPLGTARADRDPQRGVVDPDLRVHGTAGVYVADGSVVPSALGVNPQITIMSLAVRLARHLLT